VKLNAGYTPCKPISIKVRYSNFRGTVVGTTGRGRRKMMVTVLHYVNAPRHSYLFFGEALLEDGTPVTVSMIK